MSIFAWTEVDKRSVRELKAGPHLSVGRNRMGRLLNFAMFYLGWFACVMGAAHGHLWLGPSVVAVLVVLHLCLTLGPAQRAPADAAGGLLGFAVDTLQASAGSPLTRTSVAPWLCPPWMMALWMIFATTLNASMAWLAGRYRWRLRSVRSADRSAMWRVRASARLSCRCARA